MSKRITWRGCESCQSSQVCISEKLLELFHRHDEIFTDKEDFDTRHLVDKYIYNWIFHPEEDEEASR